MLVAVLFSQPTARAGHESPFYPSFYPHEIRIETLDPAAAAAGWPKARVHAYVGDDLFAGGPALADATAVESLHSYVLLTFDASAGRYAALGGDAESRCAAAGRTLRALVPRDAGFVFHPYPVTPYHPDYLEQFDLARQAQARYSVAAGDAVARPSLRIRAKGALAQRLVPESWKADPGDWDATLEEIDVGELVAAAAGPGAWDALPWIKEGWFQAYRLYAGHVREGVSRNSAQAAYGRLVNGEYRHSPERMNLERMLVSALIAGCDRVVVGYTLRREYFNANYSLGVENAAFDSQAGFLSRVFPRSVKLKDFPWNGWLRLGIATKPAAAWNPVGGFSDAYGRLLWLMVSDPAMLPAPYGSGWIANRVSVSPTTPASGAVTVPKDALKPRAGTGLLRRVGAGKTAQQRLRYSVMASAFHDGTETGMADILYPYVFAFRWSGEHPGNGGAFDPVIARSTALAREWLAGFKVIGARTQTRNFGGDLKFDYRVLVVDVYLNHRSSDPSEAAVIAPPWSTIPWELMVLMEEAVQRGIAAFSEGEAQRRGVPWLDLARDRITGERLAALVDEFRLQAYRPDRLHELVTAKEARERWTALARFYADHGHFLLTNGPYRLDSWSDGVVLQVFRDLSYPLGVGSFDEYAIPLRAFAAKIEDRGDRIEIRADVERVSRSQRNYEIERVALGPALGDADDRERPECRYVIVGPHGNVVRAGTAHFGNSGRCVIGLKDLPVPGLYSVVAALYVGSNSVNPEVKIIEHRVAGP